MTYMNNWEREMKAYYMQIIPSFGKEDVTFHMLMIRFKRTLIYVKWGVDLGFYIFHSKITGCVFY